MPRLRCFAAILFPLAVLTACKTASLLVEDAGDEGADDFPSPCTGLCNAPGGSSVVLELRCPAPVTKAELTGPCAPSGDASLFFVESPDAWTDLPDGGFGFSCAPLNKIPFAECRFVYLFSSAPGVCHVGLTFADGFVYSKDIPFHEIDGISQPGCPTCPPYVGATPDMFMVDNPSDTCDGGLE